VLAVAAFVAFWVIVAFGLFFVAARGGLGSARGAVHGQTRSANRVAITVFAFVAIAFGIALPLLMLTGNHSNASAQVGGVRLNMAERTGRELFGEHCGVCHTLAASNSVGKVGPNLDILKPAASVVLNTINNGCLPNPPKGSAEACLGQGVMPAAVVQGRQAQDVAAFVAKVAGNE
jgi:mono/diheme cytochrome c family protein